MKLVVCGLSLSSSWGNGHATTYRALLRAFAARGHGILFLERDAPWYANQRDLPNPSYCGLAFYEDVAGLNAWRQQIEAADAVIIGSYVPDGVAIARLLRGWTRGTLGFYDIDTPVTLAKLARGDHEYLSPDAIRDFDLYLSFTGGPTLRFLEERYSSPMARALYCSVDPDFYRPLDIQKRWDLSYLGTYSADRQPALERLLLDVARADPGLRCIVAGPQYPDGIHWPRNVERVEHLPPSEHPAFYSASRFTLNVTRADMITAGWSPSVRLFEASACATAVISDSWAGIEEIFSPGCEIIIAGSSTDVMVGLERDGPAIGRAARAKTVMKHSADVRAQELELHLEEARQVARPVHLAPLA
jgi:spore maturation protein CgeB